MNRPPPHPPLSEGEGWGGGSHNPKTSYMAALSAIARRAEVGPSRRGTVHFGGCRVAAGRHTSREDPVSAHSDGVINNILAGPYGSTCSKKPRVPLYAAHPHST